MADRKAPKAVSKPRRKPKRETPKPKIIKPTKGGPKIDAALVVLRQKPGSPDKGGGPDGEYWDVTVNGTRVGEVFVNMIDEAPLGRHASLQIFLNVTDQGRGIGRVAYRKSVEASRHSTIYLHMRKSNYASRLAAEAAGFRDVTPKSVSQLILKWQRDGA